jgi:hypothetical protein
VAQHGHLLAAAVLVGHEGAAERGRGAEQGEVVRAHEHAVHALGGRAVHAPQVQLDARLAAHRGRRLRRARVLREVRGGDRGPDRHVGAGDLLLEVREGHLVRLAHAGHAAEQRPVGEAEDGRVRADAEREGEDRDGGEQRMPGERAERELQVSE